MTRKALIIIGMAAVIATTSGVAFASKGGQARPEKTASLPIEISQNEEDDNSYSEYFSDEDTEDAPVELADDPTSAEEIDESGAEDGAEDDASADDPKDDAPADTAQRELDARYTILRVVDHNSGAEVKPQVAFGRYYRSCYLELYSDQSFELCLSPSSGEVQTGTYSIEEDRLVVNFGGDRETSFELTYRDDGSIDTVIFSDNEYIIYFG